MTVSRFADGFEPPPHLIAAVERAAATQPDRGVVLLEGRRGRASRRSYPELLAATRHAARRWTALGLQPRDRVLVALPTQWGWFDAWLGALFCGALPVAIAPGTALGATEAHTQRTDAIARQLDARCVVAPAGLAEAAARLGLQGLVARCLSPEALAGVTPADRAVVATPRPEETAFLQLTSGSTGLPKAVEIPHRAAILNCLASAEALGVPQGGPAWEWMETVVSWLPLNHDMGLVGCFFFALLNGADLRLLQPNSFLGRPRLWLEEHTRSRGLTFSPAPNFGLELCAQRLHGTDLEGLDLSRWAAIVAGAEMVRPTTSRRFGELLAATGFDPRVVRPSYGLAEGTVAVTIDQRGEGVRTRRPPVTGRNDFELEEVVSLGVPIPGTEVAICDRAGRSVGEGVIGAVRVQGPGVFGGYWNDPEATAAAFDDGWLQTGDLGFLHDGELYLTGRDKDVLILNGHNVMPHEIEWVADAAADGGGANRSGAFSILRSEGEEAVLVVEVDHRNPERWTELDHAVRSAVGRSLGLPLADLVLVRRGHLPKTTSGKIRRRALREQYLGGRLDRLTPPRP